MKIYSKFFSSFFKNKIKEIRFVNRLSGYITLHGPHFLFAGKLNSYRNNFDLHLVESWESFIIRTHKEKSE